MLLRTFAIVLILSFAGGKVTKNQRQHHKLLLISFDGIRWEIFIILKSNSFIFLFYLLSLHLKVTNKVKLLIFITRLLQLKISPYTSELLLLYSTFVFRFDYPDKAAELEGFKYLKENGVKAKYMTGVFPTLTSPSHFSIATGEFKPPPSQYK